MIAAKCLSLAGAFGIAFVCSGCFGSGNALPPVQVLMTSADAYSPSQITVRPGQQVVWKNIDTDAHTATIDRTLGATVGPDSSTQFPHGVPQGGTYTWTVPANAPVGTTQPYRCLFHEMMRGTIKISSN